ncbi:DNA-binding response regulator [Paucibacter aquatile]|uniref:DNA-binding response regulator n=1 Tax=Kinneretia aquatilis TaxID=2070761 RepID=A0A2N8KT16_9BURK|nr:MULTISPECIES: response regulator transcription factor [Roseateles]PND36591.1 DNA-binding response regulator [Paucibacter aquatile]WIV95813.1 response regulator transcription factor [Paucibacter aquatile]
MRLMLLEDDDTLGEGLSEFLRLEGHLVDWFQSLRDAQLVISEPYDLLLVDWQLPDGSGVDWIRQLRARGLGLPIVVLTAKDRLSERIQGLDSGADDYLVKPFQPEELAARIRALQRRSLSQGAQRRRLSAEVDMDLAAKCVYRGDQRVDLTAREWTLLEALVNRAGRVVSKSDLEALTQGFEGEAASNVVEVHVFNLRRKLGRALIETVRGLGYRVSP